MRRSATPTATAGRCRRWPGAPGTRSRTSRPQRDGLTALGRAQLPGKFPAADLRDEVAERGPEAVVVVVVDGHGDRRLQQLDQVGTLPGVHDHGNTERLRAAEVGD